MSVALLCYSVVALVVDLIFPTSLFEIGKDHFKIVGANHLAHVENGLNTGSQSRYIFRIEPTLGKFRFARAIAVECEPFPRCLDSSKNEWVSLKIDVGSFVFKQSKVRLKENFTAFKSINELLSLVSGNLQIVPYNLSTPKELPDPTKFCLVSYLCLKAVGGAIQQVSTDCKRCGQTSTADAAPFKYVCVKEENWPKNHSKEKRAETPERQVSPIKFHLNPPAYYRILRRRDEFGKLRLAPK